ncbi:phosphate:acyl-[acyl carrier protein] acyltransferase [Faunimonas pinastri]|uniref:Phosphate acyltransferase n=2 Tax=Faunimonas pinastri TaxID=1855383 RepID=A0A1H9CDB4_9HYPH|nr:phosphate:acyl-[acyl carrier protein] acyltransferase [Faunimonas pinastri]
MGGDAGPTVALAGAEVALGRRPDLSFLLYGDAAAVEPLLQQHPKLKAVSTFQHCEVAVGMNDKPSQALRKGRYKSSMWRAIQAVRDGEADVAVSAGNTGALMAMSSFCLKMLPGIQRPAIAAIWPTLRGESIVLDVGATIGADAQLLTQFAIMGAAMAQCVFDLERPNVGLLNVGVEEIKGVEEVREAGRILREINHPGFAYHGFVEGDDIGRGVVDVVVTEGFAGNIALKTAEGTARQIAQYLRSAMSRSLLSKIGYLFARPAFNMVRDKMDPRKVNGGVFLGLNGMVIKSHGGTDAEGLASAIELAREMVHSNLLERIARDTVAGEAERAALAETNIKEVIPV